MSIVAGSFAAADGGPDPLDGFQAYLDRLVSDFGVPGAAVTVVGVGTSPRFFVSGVLGTEDNRPVTPETSFDIASVTKGFTGTLAAILVGEGVVTWDTRVRDVLPEFQLKDAVATQNATLRDLLAHRTGMGRNSLPGFNLAEDPSWWLPRLRFLEPDGEFRDRDHYSGVMVTVAGLMLERAAGSTWDELLRERLLNPLGMVGTTIGPPDAANSNLALPHLRVDGETVAGPMIVSAPDVMQSGLYSTAEDMGRWFDFLLDAGRVGDSQLVSPTSLAETWTPQMALRRPFNPGNPGVSAFGLGWQVGARHGQRMLSHAGGGAGSTSYIALLPELGVGVAVLTNSALNPIPDLASYWILNRVFGVDEPDPTEGALKMVARMEAMQQAAKERALAARDPNDPPPLPLEDYAGTYSDFVYGTVEIGVEDGGLTCIFHGVELEVEHLHGNVFLFSSPLFDNLASEFEIGPAGSVTSVAVPVGRNGTSVVFERPATTQPQN